MSQIIITILTCLCLTINHFAQDVTQPYGIHYIPSIMRPIKVSAKQHIVINVNNGHVLSEFLSKQKTYPASLTKLMTLYITFKLIKKGQISLDDTVIISAKSAHAQGATALLKPNSRHKLKDLVEAIAVASGNDASVAVAEHIAGSEQAFAHMMNQTAADMGMIHTHFENASGLPHKKHVSSAHDLAILARHIHHQQPELHPYLKQKWFKYNKVTQANRNRLLWHDPDTQGMKTGHTEDAGYCMAISSTKRNQTYISITLGSANEQDRLHANQDLINHAHTHFEHKTIDVQKPLARTRVWYGDKTSGIATLKQPLTVSIPRDDKTISKQIQLDREVFAPTPAGHPVGQLTILYHKTPIHSVPLVLSQALNTGSLWSRFVDLIHRSLASLLSLIIGHQTTKSTLQ